NQGGVVQRPYLIVRNVPVGVLLVELRQSKGEGVSRPRVVTGHALRPAGEMPRLLAFAAGGLGVHGGEGAVDAGGGAEGRVGLLVVPLVGVAVPGSAVEVEDLRLQPAPAARVAALHLQRDGPGEDAILGEEDLAVEEAFGDRDRAVVHL